MNTNIISLIFSGVMMIVGVSTFIITQVRSGRNNELQAEKNFSDIRTDLTAVRLKLEEVSSTVNETKLDVKNLNTNLVEIDKRLTKVEENLKTAFMRIDELREGKADR